MSNKVKDIWSFDQRLWEVLFSAKFEHVIDLFHAVFERIMDLLNFISEIKSFKLFKCLVRIFIS